MSPLLSISTFRRTDATGGSRGEAMPEREIIIVKREQIMAETFGHSNNFDTLSLSQVLTYNNLYIVKIRGCPRKYKAFLAEMQGRPVSFIASTPCSFKE